MGPKDTEPAAVHAVTFADYEKFLPYIYASQRKSANQLLRGGVYILKIFYKSMQGI